ncbi:hypothetical protein RR46_15098 [Papilio xuthus]|uniref:Uncharacterized protein n=1 Tax=Papilio xuthus TaxID=66420 RepID=A0A194PFW8_PAPXU|nr:hypothetical protein RR46_15098 [Papilio xuthus]
MNKIRRMQDFILGDDIKGTYGKGTEGDVMGRWGKVRGVSNARGRDRVLQRRGDAATEERTLIDWLVLVKCSDTGTMGRDGVFIRTAGARCAYSVTDDVREISEYMCC